MKKSELLTELRNFNQIRDYIEKLLSHRRINDRTRNETLLVFEALYNDMLAQGFPEDTMIQIWKTYAFGETRIKIAFDGPAYVSDSDLENEYFNDDEFDPDAKVIQAFGDKIENRYHGGRNHLILTAKRNALRQMRLNVLSALLAVLAYIPIVILVEKTGHQELIGKYVYYTEKLFTDTILCVGGPVTFFALLRNLTSIFITAEGDSLMRRLEIKAITTSLMAVILAVFACYLIQFPFFLVFFIIHYSTRGFFGGNDLPELNLDIRENAFEILDSLADSNILDTFGSFAPFPLIVIALLTTYAMCSAGSYYESFKKVIDGCYVLFSKMLAAVMYTMPFFVFMAMLDVMLKAGRLAAIFLSCLVIFVPLSMLIMAGFYAVRLLIAGVNPLPFTKKMVPLLKENLEINSTIDAVPFNIRYCVTKFGLSREWLNKSLPALSRINLDGNCFIITLISIMFLILTGNGVTSSDVVVIGVVIFFLSLGAPNQPGSTLIGLLVIISYMEAPEMISLAVFSEALFGGILSMTNAAGDIVTVMTAEQKAKKIARKNAAEDAAGSEAGGQVADSAAEDAALDSAAEESGEAAQEGQAEAAEPENGIEDPQ